jgi:hypothetical protein
MKKSVAAALAPVLFAGGLVGLAQTDWGVVKTLKLGGEGAWDYVTVDPHTHQVHVARTTHTLVIDGTSGKTVADIGGQTRAHGVAIVPEDAGSSAMAAAPAPWSFSISRRTRSLARSSRSLTPTASSSTAPAAAS